MSPIPLVDLTSAHAEMSAEIRRGFDSVLARTAFIQGEEVASFEREYASFLGSRHCISVSNGTDALELALRAVGLRAGDEVLVPVNTFIASAMAVVRAGGVPVFVDCDDRALLLDVEKASARVGPRTRFIMPVHLYGQIVAMEHVESLAAEAGLRIVEDAAQAQGARRHGKTAGTFGVAAGTSFYPGKNLGAYGDAGAITVDDDALAEKLAAMRSYGSRKKYQHDVIGFNCRMDTLQAVVLRAKLAVLEEWNERRRRAAQRYDAMLEGVRGVRRTETLDGNEHVYHLYVVRLADRDRVVRELNDRGIGAQIHYPQPLHLTGAFRNLGGGGGDFPVAEAAADEVLSLPIYPQITAEQQERVIEELLSVVDR